MSKAFIRHIDQTENIRYAAIPTKPVSCTYCGAYDHISRRHRSVVVRTRRRSRWEPLRQRLLKRLAIVENRMGLLDGRIRGIE